MDTNTDRKLATVRCIDKLEPIEGADRILKATVGGWELVTAKDNGFKEGDLVVYLEIDSFVPHTIAPFLTPEGHFPKVFNGVEGQRLKTKKLRGVVSQGLIMPSSVLDIILCDDGYQIVNSKYMVDLEQQVRGINVVEDGLDVTGLLGIQKWEKPIPAQLAGIAKGNFPSFIKKTDQPRVQNLTKEFLEWKEQNLTFEVTEKLEGSSMTVYHRVVDGEVETGVCSRNLNLKETKGNAFWQVARKEKLIEKLIQAGRNIALQGELVGPGVQGNIYNLKELEFRLFDVFDIDTSTYYNSIDRDAVAAEMDIKHAPIIGRIELSQFDDIQAVLKYAEGKSAMFNTEREGVVFKCVKQPEISFKAISNKYLVNEKD